MTKTSEIRDIMSSPDRKAYEGGNPLTRIWRGVLLDRNLNYGQLSSKVKRWVTDVSINVDDSTKISTTGNIIKALFGNNLSFNTFDRGVRSLKPFGFRIVFKIYHRNHDVSTHVDYSWDNLDGFDRKKDMTDPESIRQSEEIIHKAYNEALTKTIEKSPTYYK